MDRLEEIKLRYRGPERGYISDEIGWLISEVESLRAEVSRLTKLDELHQKTATPAEHVVQLCEMYHQQLAVTQETICGMKEAFTDISEYWNGSNNEKAVSGALQHALDVSEQILSSTPTCPHKERAEGIIRDELAEQARLITERDAAKAQLTQVREALKQVHQLMLNVGRSTVDEDVHDTIKICAEALSQKEEG